MTDDFYIRALGRIRWLTAGVGVAGSLAILVARGTEPAGGFLIGAGISFFNFLLLCKFAEGLSGSSKRFAVVVASLRYVLLAAVAYAIVRILGITPLPVLAGLLAAFAAVILEILYEFIFHARA